MSLSRRPHPKTRTGCKTCKRRKVKCDEQRPSCGNCIKHSVQCDYFFAPPPSTPSALELADVNSPTDGILSGPQSHASSPYDVADAYPGNGPPRPLQMLELQMLHHYTTSTCFTICRSSILNTLWKITIPNLAFEYEVLLFSIIDIYIDVLMLLGLQYVMRGILAFGAQHLAYCQPDRRDFWIAQAMLQHRAASAVAMSVLSNVTANDFPPLYVFAMITTIFALASPRKPGGFLLVGENAEWLFLFRGLRSIVDVSMGSLLDTPLGPLFLAGARRDQLRKIETKKNYLSELEEYINGSATPETLPIYTSAIVELRDSYNVIYAHHHYDLEVADVFIWPYRVLDEYLILLRQHSPESLVIFAYFCVLLKRLEGNWWMQNWSAQLISQIYDLLNEECRLWIRWPMEEIGWAPEAPYRH